MRIVVGFILLFLIGVMGNAPPSWGQGRSDSDAHGQSGHGRSSVVIRGESVGFVSVSPALQNALKVKHGKRSDPDPGAMGPNAEVRSDGFTYVSASARGKSR